MKARYYMVVTAMRGVPTLADAVESIHERHNCFTEKTILYTTFDEAAKVRAQKAYDDEGHAVFGMEFEFTSIMVFGREFEFASNIVIFELDADTHAFTDRKTVLYSVDYSYFKFPEEEGE